MYHTLSQKVVQKIATYKSFVQYEIGEKYMDDLSQCPKIIVIYTISALCCLLFRQ